MSKPVQQVLACPECGHEQSITIWESIDCEASPTVTQALIDGSLFRFECEECGAVNVIDYPCIYKDPMHRVLLYHIVDDSAVPEIEKMFARLEEARLDEGDPYVHHRRIVRSINSLREKAAIFDDELDDRVVEIVKAVFKAYATGADEMAGRKVDEIFYSGMDDDSNLIMYMVGPSGQDTGTIPLAFYEKVEDAYLYGSEIPEESYYVDYEWAIRWIDESDAFS